ncbi:MAG: hypothetical protein HY270_10250 [Deltaproteobacteria bacterium]|nr:hypothetical protein [Deltaproteobacteria bacterium]
MKHLRLEGALVGLIICSFVAPAGARTKATPAQKCAAAKLRAAGKKAKAKLFCHASAVLSPTFDLAACLTKAETHFMTAFANAEAPGGCALTGDANVVETAKVDPFVASVVAGIPSAVPTPTPSLTATATPTATPIGKIIFVTSTVYDGNLGGVAGADAKCAARAAAGGLSGTYMAWLSTTTSSAASRLNHETGPYRLLSGTQVAANWNDLTDGSIATAIVEDENNTTLTSVEVWTGTTYIGTSDSFNCNDFTSSASSGVGMVGLLITSNSNWTNYTNVSCDSAGRLYCIQQ